eukprot:11121452-Karenia_brevis.AAC.1
MQGDIKEVKDANRDIPQDMKHAIPEMQRSIKDITDAIPELRRDIKAMKDARPDAQVNDMNDKDCDMQ